jgi:hypothetical protein
MPTSDPNKKMEDLLRAYAKKRREEAGPLPELSPAVRARLQQEVRRASGRAVMASRRRWGLPLNWWVRLAFGGAFAALVLLVVWPKAPIGLKNRALADEAKKVAASEDLLAATERAKNAEMPPAAPVASAAPAPLAPPPPGRSPAPDPSRPLAANTIAPPAAKRPSSDATEVSTPAPATRAVAPAGAASSSGMVVLDTSTASGAANDSGAVRGGFGGGGGGGGGFAGGTIGGRISEDRALALAPGAPPNAALPSADKLANADAPSATISALPPRMQPAAPPDRVTYAMKSTVASPSVVLASFQMERVGAQIRVIDADGSIYQGQVADQVVMEKAASAANLQQNALPQQASLLGGFTFQVSGMNRTLNQRVAFTGSFFSAPLKQYVTAYKAAAGENKDLTANQGSIANNSQNNLQNLNSAQYANSGQIANNFVNQAPVAKDGQNNSQNLNNTQYANSGQFANNGYIGDSSQQNLMAKIQVWQVSGRVQVGPTTQFDLEAVTLQP